MKTSHVRLEPGFVQTRGVASALRGERQGRHTEKLGVKM